MKNETVAIEKYLTKVFKDSPFVWGLDDMDCIITIQGMETGNSDTLVLTPSFFSDLDKIVKLFGVEAYSKNNYKIHYVVYK